MKFEDIIIKLLINNPFYGYIAASVTPIQSENIDTVKMVSIPSLKIFYNPKWFDELTTNEKTGIVIHELLHVILLHPYRIYNRDTTLWAVACDMAVNEYMNFEYLSNGAITVDKISTKIKINLDKYKSAEYYYHIITDVDDIVNKIGVEGDSILLFDDDKKLKANKMSNEKASDTDIKSLKYNLSQTIEQSKSEGQIPDILQDNIEDVYKEFRINWRNIIKRFVTGRGKMIIRKSYKRQSRRYENLPGTKRTIGINALVAIDESGSISDELAEKFYNELKIINKITGAYIMVTRFDVECSEPIPLDNFLINNQRQKKGGTDFRPVFSLADKMKIPLIIIFTDGEGEAPESVNQNTLWVITKDGKKPGNFGYYLDFED